MTFKIILHLQKGKNFNGHFITRWKNRKPRIHRGKEYFIPKYMNHYAKLVVNQQDFS